MSSCIRYAVVAAVGLALCGAPQAIRADDLDSVVSTMTREIKRYLEEKGEKAISIGEFKGPRTSAGKLIEVNLKKKLQDSGVSVVDELDAQWEIRGTLSNREAAQFTIVAVEVGLFDSNGIEIKTFRERFNEATELSRSDILDRAADTAEKPANVDPPATTDTPQQPSANPTAASSVAQNTETPAALTNVQGAVVDNPSDVARLNGATVDLVQSVESAVGFKTTSGAPAQTRLASNLTTSARDAIDVSIKSAIKQPSFHTHSASVIAASQTSPFRIEIVATPPSQPGPYLPINVQSKGGHAFAQLQEGQMYGVKVYNEADFDIGVELSIDGINSLALCVNADFAKTGKWLIPARSSATIKGWLIDPSPNRSRLDPFLITAQPQGVAVELGRTQSIGMVTAAFFPAWQGEEVPVFERLVAGVTRNIATGRGPSENFTGTSVARTFGTEPFALITVRYKNPDPPSDLPLDGPLGTP